MIRNKYVRGNIGVTSIVNKLRDNILRRFGHVMRRENSKTVRTPMEMNVERNRKRRRRGKRRGRPKKKCLDVIRYVI